MNGPARQAKPPRGPRPSGAWHSLAEASESTASLVAVVLLHGPTSSGGVRHHRTTSSRSAQLWWARNGAQRPAWREGRPCGSVKCHAHMRMPDRSFADDPAEGG